MNKYEALENLADKFNQYRLGNLRLHDVDAAYDALGNKPPANPACALVVLSGEGLTVRVGLDGVWIELRSQSGLSVNFQPINMFYETGGAFQAAVEAYCGDQQNKFREANK